MSQHTSPPWILEGLVEREGHAKANENRLVCKRHQGSMYIEIPDVGNVALVAERGGGVALTSGAALRIHITRLELRAGVYRLSNTLQRLLFVSCIGL